MVVDMRSSMGPTARDGQAEAAIARSPFPGAGHAPPPGHYSAQMAPHFRPATPATLGVSPVHQTPVPIPHPPHHAAPAPSHMPIRPMRYQNPHQHLQHQLQPQPQQPQAGYAHATHQQSMGTPLPAGSSSSVPTRAAFASVTGNAPQHSTAYNPPRPPEVYTLTEDANERLPLTLRQSYQHDEAGRVFFFTAPPLDRHHKGLSPGSAGLGHSVRYLAGRAAWLAEREMKRKRRDEDASKRGEPPRKSTTTDEGGATDSADTVVRQATNAINEWFRQLDHETHEWRTNAGLEGWRNAT